MLARAYTRSGVTYGRVAFNTKHLGGYKPVEVAVTIMHEIGRTMGLAGTAMR
jgi:hypothetical protein